MNNLEVGYEDLSSLSLFEKAGEMIETGWCADTNEGG